MTAPRSPADVSPADVSPADVFAAVLHAHADRPLVTWYDESPAHPARVELSARSVANWAAKTAGLLTDELGLGPGDRALVRLPAHWLAIGVLAGIWNAGLEVVTTGDAAVAFVTTTIPGPGPTDAEADANTPAEADTPADEAGADEVFTMDPASPLQLAGPDDVRPGTRDLPTALRPHPDRLGPARGRPDGLALAGRRGAAVMTAAADRAATLGLDDGRWVVPAAGGGVLTEGDIVDVVLAPWTAGGAVVWVHGPASAERLARIGVDEGARPYLVPRVTGG